MAGGGGRMRQSACDGQQHAVPVPFDRQQAAAPAPAAGGRVRASSPIIAQQPSPTPPPTSPQARMNLEPMVRLESRLVNLDPVAQALPHLPALSLQDATFTRDPWPVGLEARKLPELADLEVEWGAALWAPGQMIHEWAALQVRGWWGGAGVEGGG